MQSAIPQVTLPRRDGPAQLVVPRLSMPPGLACGSIVLTWLYNGTGGSILACAVWHGLYNLETGTAGATATIQAVTTAFIYVLAFLLVGFELRARRRGEAPILGPRRGATSPSGLPGATLL